MKRTPEQRLAKHIEIDKNTGCWNWTSNKDKDGYGVIRFNNKFQRAHRLSYTTYKGTIPDQFFVLHTCDNPSCVNPEHLYAGTHTQNMADKRERQRVAGHQHPYSKLTDTDILAIRASTLSQEKLGNLYGVTQAHISRIVRRINWSHI